MTTTPQTPPDGASGAPRRRLGRDGRLIVWLLSICIVGAVALLVAVREAREHILLSEAGETATHWARLLQRNIADFDELIASGSLSERDRRLFDIAGEAGGVIRYKIFGPDGTVVVASRDDIPKAFAPFGQTDSALDREFEGAGLACRSPSRSSSCTGAHSRSTASPASAPRSRCAFPSSASSRGGVRRAEDGAWNGQAVAPFTSRR